MFWGVRPTGVLHVGAHEAEELAEYQAAGWGPVVWVEGLPDKAAQLRERLLGARDQHVFGALAWDSDGDMLTMRRTNNDQASSVLPMGTHLVEHPEIHVVEEIALPTARLDTLLAGTPHRFDFVNLDIQGAELRALRGLGDRLRGVRWIYCEVMEKPLYIGAPLVGELDAYLSGCGFNRVDTQMTPHGWGDALYVHASTLPRLTSMRRALRKSRAPAM